MAPNPRLVEPSAEYAISMTVILTRFYARRKGTNRRWTADDYFMGLAMITYTAMLATYVILQHTPTNVHLVPAMVAKMTPEEIHKVENGSKLLISGWTMYVTTINALKASLICYFFRLGFTDWQRWVLVVDAFLCGATYVACILAGYLQCFPFRILFQVKPIPPAHCTSLLVRQIPVGFSNIVTDFLLLILPIPLLLRVTIPLRKKIVVGVLLSGGVFVIAASAVRMVYVFQSPHNPAVSTLWSHREVFIGVLVVNAPHIRVLVRVLWPSSQAGSSGSRPSALNTIGSSGQKVISERKRRQLDHYIVDDTENNSQEQILDHEAGAGENYPMQPIPESTLGPLEIRTDRTYHVTKTLADTHHLEQMKRARITPEIPTVLSPNYYMGNAASAVANNRSDTRSMSR